MHDFDDRWERNWRRMEAMARRGFRRIPGMGRGDWNAFGGNIRIGRMLASGDLRLVALYFIEQQPRHGYDLIKAIEDKSASFYSPSPGIVYPALTFLEEAGYVTSAADGNKKLYTITDEGRTHLADNREAIESTLAFLGKAGEKMKAWSEAMHSETGPFGDSQSGWPFAEGGSRPPEPPEPPTPPVPPRADRDIDDVLPEVNQARRELKKAIRKAVGRGEEAQFRVAEILRRAAADIRATDDEDDIDL